MVIQPQRAALTAELPGRTVAYRMAQVRPQISGIIQKRLYNEGATVQAGQALYQIDPGTYRAAHDSAAAAVAKAEANALTVKLRPLSETGTVGSREPAG
jgi:membrane fusion protein (multidrug efflux system)